MSTAEANESVDAGWLDWIAENHLRGCSSESMEAAMAARGVSADEARSAIAGIESQPLFATARRLARRLAKLESVTSNLQRLWELAPAYAQVPRRAGLTAEQFLHEHVIAQRPVVLTDVAHDWPALQRWTPAYLRQRFGGATVEVQSGRDRFPDQGGYELRKLALRRRMPLRELVDEVLASPGGNDLYLTANNEALREPQLAALLHDIGTLPPYVDATRMDRDSCLWFGPAGTVTPLHHDTVMLLHTQIVGRKRWLMSSPLETPRLDNERGVFSPIDLERPDLVRWPALASMRVLDVTVERGETLFVPLGWWHQVRSLDLCISLSFTNLAVPNAFEYRNP